nr:hypothetical protein [Candidatus Njordarchaeota archaeon]
MRRIVAAILLASYSATEIALIFFSHGTWFVVAREEQAPIVAASCLDLSPARVLILGLPFIITAYLAVLSLVFFSIGKEDRYIFSIACDAFFPALVSASVFLGGVGGTLVIPLAYNWVNIAALCFAAAIPAWSHFFLLNFSKIKKKLSVELEKIADFNIYGKRLELEHSFLQTTFQWAIWAFLIVLTSGIWSTLVKPLEPLPIRLMNTVIQNAILVTIWFGLGFWFGIIGPILGHMEYLRLLLAEASRRKSML